jgi:hypothetical protein
MPVQEVKGFRRKTAYPIIIIMELTGRDTKG